MLECRTLEQLKALADVPRVTGVPGSRMLGFQLSGVWALGFCGLGLPGLRLEFCGNYGSADRAPGLFGAVLGDRIQQGASTESSLRMLHSMGQP